MDCMVTACGRHDLFRHELSAGPIVQEAQMRLGSLSLPSSLYQNSVSTGITSSLHVTVPGHYGAMHLQVNPCLHARGSLVVKMIDTEVSRLEACFLGV